MKAAIAFPQATAADQGPSATAAEGAKTVARQSIESGECSAKANGMPRADELTEVAMHERTLREIQVDDGISAPESSAVICRSGSLAQQR